MVAVDCRPLSVLDSKIASHWQHVATGGFWNGIRHDAVGTELQRILGVEIKPALKKLLASADRVAITTDFWTAPQTAGSYAGVTAHFFVETDRDIRLHRAVLAFDLMQGMRLSHGSLLHPDSGRVGCVVRGLCNDRTTYGSEYRRVRPRCSEGVERSRKVIRGDDRWSVESAKSDAVARQWRGILDDLVFGASIESRDKGRLESTLLPDWLIRLASLSCDSALVSKLCAAMTKRFRQTAAAFKRSSLQMSKLEELKKQLKIESRRLALDCVTRFNSTLPMLESILPIQPAYIAMTNDDFKLSNVASDDIDLEIAPDRKSDESVSEIHEKDWLQAELLLKVSAISLLSWLMHRNSNWMLIWLFGLLESFEGLEGVRSRYRSVFRPQVSDARAGSHAVGDDTVSP